MAAATRTSGSVSRQSEWLLPPQPLLPQGRQACPVDATTRCGTRHGPHSRSPDGPNSATVGVPIAAAMSGLLDATRRAGQSRQALAAVAELTPAAMGDRLIALYDALLPAGGRRGL